MKNNYTKRLFDVLQYSREEAVRLQSSYIGPEHLMLGILRDGNGIAYDTLAELDVNLSLLKKKIEQNLKNSFDDSFDHSEIAVTKETERVLRMSMLEAKLFKKTETGTEHLLLAILKDANNTAASVLLEENVDYRTVYNMLVNGTGMKRLEEESDEIRMDILMMTTTKTMIILEERKNPADLPEVLRDLLNLNHQTIHLF